MAKDDKMRTYAALFCAFLFKRRGLRNSLAFGRRTLSADASDIVWTAAGYIRHTMEITDNVRK